MYSTQILPLNQLQRESERRRSLLLYLLPRVWISQFDRKSLWSVSQPLTIIVIQHKQLKSTVLLSLHLLVECESCKTARFNWVSQNGGLCWRDWIKQQSSMKTRVTSAKRGELISTFLVCIPTNLKTLKSPV